MVTIRLTGRVTEDRRLIVEIPDNIPAGDVQLTLEILDSAPAANDATARARVKLEAAGALSTIWKAPPGTTTPTEDELIELGALPPGSPSMEELVNADRDGR